MEKRRRIVNYRPMCFAALALILGIVVGEALYGEHVALISVPIVAGAAGIVLLACFRRTRRLFYIPLALLVGFAAIYINNVVYDSRVEYTEWPTYASNITATVSGAIYTVDGESTFYIHDIHIGDKKLKFDGRVTIDAEEFDFNAGDAISIAGRIRGCGHTRFDTLHVHAISTGTAYYIDADKVQKLSEGELGFPLNLQHKMKSIFYEQLDGESASVCTAMLLGDKFGMDEALSQSISASGLAHLLAVSGLHITTLATAIYFVLKKLKVKPWISLAVVTCITFLYALICSFAASVLRAFVMSFVFNAASCFGKKRDNISAISFAAILILTFRPTALMELGFLLSFSSMLGIFMFHRSLDEAGQKVVNKISPKRHIGKKAVSLSCVAISATLMSYPFIAYSFGYLPLFQLVSNIIFVPYMMAFYVVMLVASIFGLVTTLHPAVYVLRIMLFPFLKYVSWVGSLSVNAINLPPITVPGMVLYLIVVMMASRYVLIPAKDKARGVLIAAASSVAICAALALI